MPTDVHLTVEQAILDAVRKPAQRWNTEATLRVFQIVAIIIGGAWAYYTYVTFQKKSNDLALKAAQARLRESELALQKAQVDIQKGTIEVNRMSQAPVTTTERLHIEPLADAKSYFVSYDYTFANSGNGRVMITPVMAEAFVARTPAMDGDTLINDVADPGALQWQVLSRHGFVARDHWRADMKVVNLPDEALAENGGGGTGTMNAGESLDGNITLLVHGKPTDFVGFRIRYSIYAIVDGKEKLVSDNERLRNFSPLGITPKGKEKS